MNSRIWNIAAATVLALCAATGSEAAAELKVTLLGTGTPTPRLSSF